MSSYNTACKIWRWWPVITSPFKSDWVKPEGSLADQLAHAEATNLQLGFGTAMAREITGRKLHALREG
jgi:hypothetical protein